MTGVAVGTRNVFGGGSVARHPSAGETTELLNDEVLQAGPPVSDAKRRRQWGAESDTSSLTIFHNRPGLAQLTWSRLAIIFTVFAWAMYVITIVVSMWIEREFNTLRVVIEAAVYLLIVTLLVFSASMYLLSRRGALVRFRDHKRVARAVLDKHFSADRYHHGITMLVPSYVEEVSVVEKTLWSAALQEFPDKRVVLLIDDPPYPTDPERNAELSATRLLGDKIMQELAQPAARFAEALRAEKELLKGMSRVGGGDLARVGAQYRWAAEWVSDKADRWPIIDHTDLFFRDEVLEALAEDFRQVVTSVDLAVQDRGDLSRQRVEQMYSRLVRIFTVSVDSFERKRYASLSHEANKAMNLNSYIYLMGHRWKRVETPAGIMLEPVPEGHFADLLIPDSEYILTLDADSMLLRDYCLRLVYHLEQPTNERIAVIQTPYSSYRGATTRIERIAGATTDIQHILHQGLTFYGATFWVGANAVIRKRALEDIAVVNNEGPNTVTVYIQDRTVIEDTESSIDLGLYDWTLENYPERLSYSATPPDFGSLVIQRRRWANGGLLILPKFWRERKIRKTTRNPVQWPETTLRVNYMASIAWASFGLIMLLAYPFDSRLLSPWVIAAALPYFISMAMDLKSSRYKYLDVFRIYAFNLVLLAVNTSGTVKSVEQGITNEKIPFARTPKVEGRTSAPWTFALAPYVIIIYSAYVFVLYVVAQNWGNAAFAAFNGVLCAVGLVSFIGIRNSLQDIFLGLLNWFYVPDKRALVAEAAAGQKDAPELATTVYQADWKSELYFGQVDPDRVTAVP